ncbi:nucleotidyltransferase family protein [Sphingomonas sp. ABOLD]|uniref:MurNAc alpha-1-phosphate uridylyltransferase n=1 Tax=Sphingomonas trueperi TaxID=53317 RepID=A0A7X6BCM8_9SPHN|nr:MULTISPECIES: nucleotidyltransferase family protein [Sphingomonas]NJB97036.1 MurNAc alpha-1-phosphate uridylyltransferase [Sphingomonas trueperi]RSV42803.1 nucleotidyltransferase family protein [Sphingomonas sp. ABOLE]RSV50789.1 nucleotidyltransferase family protein [Sphingomonas sp. ABOLD]
MTIYSLRPQPAAPVPKTAMVMAAGLGKRMRPLTVTRPKPLIDVAGKPLIDHVFDRLSAAGVERAVVNVHYLADQLEAHLRARVKGIELTISDERKQLLETGGGLVQARAMLGDAPFLCVNSDNLWVDGPSDAIRLLASQWDDAKMDALLLLVPLARATCHRGQGDFRLDAFGRITERRKPGRLAPFVFTGIQILSPRVIRDWPEGPFSTNLFWNRAMEAGRLWGAVHQGLWFDVGSPKAIRATELALAEL